jgi:hypothetical protein
VRFNAHLRARSAATITAMTPTVMPTAKPAVTFAELCLPESTGDEGVDADADTDTDMDVDVGIGGEKLFGIGLPP